MTKAYRRQRPPHQHRWDTNLDPGGRTNRLLKEEREREAAEGLEDDEMAEP